MSVNAAHRLREEIESLIATGGLLPGTRLEEAQLASRFGVSRTPVREALHQLRSAGLVEIRPRRGAVVADARPERLFEMFEVMAELEGLCARLAARRLLDSDRETLQAALEACREACLKQDPDAYYEENERFHHALYRASRNGFLEEEALRLQARLRPFRRLQLRVRNRVATSFVEHEAIVAAIVAGDMALAAERTRAHVFVQGERFADLVASLNGLREAARREN